MKKTILGLIAMVALASGLAMPAMASPAPSSKGGSFAQQATEGLKQVGGNDQTSLGDIVSKIINFLLFFVGVVSVIMIIYGGIQYTTSAGDSGKVTNAKNTILYAIVGLIVSILAYAIVNFVTNAFLSN